ncbi:MAG: aldo/keto reductase [Candidatus Omnitrophica bacterium]|nr:aldo/keto reductase [Candidatus Omnitrophota bacterium]
MKYRVLGRTQLRVSEIGFGSWAIGGSGYGPTNDDESLDALQAARDKGVNFFDTADTYGQGHSEEILARFLKDCPRAEFVLATKAGWDFYHGGSKKNFDPEYLSFACEQSLKRLGLEFIDLYQLHNPSLELIQNGAAVGALAKLKEQGKIRFIGISVHKEEEAFAAMADGRVDALQVMFNLLDQRMAKKVFSKAAENKTAIVVREPLACGLLTGKYVSADHEFHKEDHRRRWTREKKDLDLKKIERLRPILSTARLTFAQAAIEFILDHSAVSTVIPGAKSRAQILENIKASEEPGLRIQEAAQLRDLFHRDPLFQEGLL